MLLDPAKFRDALGDGEDRDKVLWAVRQQHGSENCPDYFHAAAFVLGVVRSFLDLEDYVAGAAILWGNSVFDSRPATVRLIFDFLAATSQGIIIGASSLGKSYTSSTWMLLDWIRDPEYTSVKCLSTTAGHLKCFGRGTRVRMFNGDVREIQDIRRGDVVMGPDSKPRRVLETTSGREKMYDVKPLRGPGFVCNASHLLYLENTIDDPSRWKKLGKPAVLTVSDYVQKSASFKREYKMVRQGFELEPIWQLFDPYIVGLWLGDGHTNAPALTNMDQAIVDEWCHFFERSGYRIKKYSNGSKANTYFAFFGAQGRRDIKNPFRSFLREECLENGEKRIPTRILRSSANHRWAVLAGILDTDGTVNDGGFCLTIKSKPLARDVLDLCHSLGLHANQREIKTKSQNGTEGTYQTLCIRGDFRALPTLVKKPHQVGTRHRYVPFRVQELPEDDYFGFSVGGDELFLLENGLIVHNSNVFSTLHRLHAEAVVPLPGLRLDGFIGLDSKDRYSSIERVSVRDGEDGAAALKGFHPIPRRKKHPIFGWFSRVRALLDEAEDVPQGVWSSVGNLLSSKHGSEVVKILGCANPRDVTSVLAGLAEPDCGWAQVDPDEDYIWKSRNGWDTLRLDGAVTENVVQDKVVYVNFLTREGYDNFALKDGGDSADYWTFARGIYPLKGHTSGVMPPALFDGVSGEYIFSTFSIGAAGIDLAFEGADKAKMAVGRYGEVTGFRHRSGKVVEFKTPFWAAQLDQIIDLKKMLTYAQAKNIFEILSVLMIQPEWVLLDKTGNATGVYDDLRVLWNPKVQGIGFGESASVKKITDQDTDFPEEIYQNSGTEMYFAVARWLEHGYLRCGPHVDVAILQQQFTRRRVKSLGKGPTGKQMKRLEKKDEYKKRYRNESPDDADAVCLFLHVCRMNGKEKASALGLRRPEINRELASYDQMKWVHPDQFGT